MKKEEASNLLNRYLSAVREGKEPYFDADEIDNLLDSFEESEDFSRYDEILALGIKLHPGSTDLRIRECKSCIFHRNFYKAISLIDKIADRNNPELELLRLECWCNLEEFNKVNAFIDELIQSGSNLTEVVLEHVIPVLNDLDNLVEARKLIEKGLRLFPDNLVFKDELCYLLESEGNFKEAIRLCNELIDKDPFSYDCWFTLGRLYTLSGEFTKAIDAFDYALTCDDTEPELKILRAYCLFMDERYEEAIRSYEEMEVSDEFKLQITPLLAECYLKLESFEEAYDVLKDLIYQTNEEVESTTYINFVRSCMETGRDEEADRILNKAVNLFPEDVRLMAILAMDYLDNGQEDKAFELTSKIFSQISRVDEEVDADCRDLFPKSIQMMFKGNLNKTLRFYKKMVNVPDDLPFMEIHKAMAYFSLGDMEMFNKYFKRTTRKELKEYLLVTGMGDVQAAPLKKHIQPDELTKDYLGNKDNNN